MPYSWDAIGKYRPSAACVLFEYDFYGIKGESGGEVTYNDYYMLTDS